MKVDERLTLVVAVLLGLFGFVMLAGVLIGVLEGTSRYSPVTDLSLSFLFGVLPLALSWLLFRLVREAWPDAKEKRLKPTC
jgi:TRAP-type C4-dicarboxylate transport system permease small subunit